MSQNIEDLYLQSYPFTTAAAIIGSVDRKVFVMLYDGRTIFGVLRSFDQFGNLIIHDGIERIYVNDKKQYAESSIPMVYYIRGENLVLMGEIDIDKEDDILQNWERIDYDTNHALISYSVDAVVEDDLKYKKFGMEAPSQKRF